jgi:hypothetical protein
MENIMESVRKPRCFICGKESEELVLVPSIVSLETDDGGSIVHYPVCKECWDNKELI